jgi:molybdate transport system substrate-binding protein
MTTRRFLAVVLAAALALVAPLWAADDSGLVVLCSNGIKATVEELAPRFERDSHTRVTVKYDLAANLKRRIESGEAFDVAIVTPAATDDLIKQGKIAANSRTMIARSDLAFEMRAGGRKPDLSTVDALKNTLLNAKTVAFAKEGASGILFQQAITKLGIADKVKMMPTTTGEAVSAAVVNGTAEFGILPVSEILPVKGAEVAGTFPGETRSFIEMVGGVNAASAHAAEARKLIEFLVSAQAAPVLKKTGMVRK